MADSDVDIAAEEEQLLEQHDSEGEVSEHSHSRESTPESKESEEADITARVEQLVVVEGETHTRVEEFYEEHGYEEEEETAKEETIVGASVDVETPQLTSFAVDIHSSPELDEISCEREEPTVTVTAGSVTAGSVTPPTQEQTAVSPVLTPEEPAVTATPEVVAPPSVQQATVSPTTSEEQAATATTEVVTPPSGQQATVSPAQTSSSGSGGAKKKGTKKKKLFKPTVAKPFNFHTDRRIEERNRYQQRLAREQKAQEEREKIEQARREKEEEEALKEYRRTLIPKAKPIRYYNPITITPSKKPLTLPDAPKLECTSRTRRPKVTDADSSRGPHDKLDQVL